MSVLALLPLFAASAQPSWYGPASVSFEYAAPGNPYDAELNDLAVLFSGPGGRVEKRPAFFDDGKWKAWLVAPAPGTYSGRLYRNGSALKVPPVSVKIVTKLKDGFVRKGKGQSFQFDSGERYWPLGHNLGWFAPGQMPALPQALKRMGSAGINWSRIWACTWDGKNPWWPSDKVTVPIGDFWPKALKQWDDIVSAADQSGVHFQFVLFHHGEFSSTTDSNWGDNPWNIKNGGFLKDPAEFFTDPRAKQLSRNWLRYAVARYGYSPAVMSWELFNEVQWVDAVKNGHSAEVGKWHDDMARYVRSVDPYHHLVMTSSDISLPIWRSMDYYSPHGYPPSVAAMVLGTDLPSDKPLFYGEVGPGDLGGAKAVQKRAVRDGIWSGLLALQAGAAQFWAWDQVFSLGLLSEYRQASDIIRRTGVLQEPGLKRVTIDLDAGQGGDLSLPPGGGWEPTRQLEYNLPADTNHLGKLSTYFQGLGHKDMRTGPVVFRFHAPKASAFDLRVSGMSSGGAHVTISVNGALAAEKTWGAGTQVRGSEIVRAPVPAGDVEVKIDNDGPDWFQLSEVRIAGIAPRVSGVAIANQRMLLARIQRSDTEQAPTATLKGLGLRDGTYEVNLTDLDGSRTQIWRSLVKKGELTSGLPVSGQDSILYLRKAGK